MFVAIDQSTLAEALKPLKDYAAKDPATLPENQAAEYSALLAQSARKLMEHVETKGWYLSASEAVNILTTRLKSPNFAEREPRTEEEQGAFWAKQIQRVREQAAAAGKRLSYAEAAAEAAAQVAMGGRDHPGTVVAVVR